MFWESVKDGLLVLTYWETYVSILIYFAIFIIPAMIFAVAMEKNEAIGCLGAIITPFVQTFASIVFIFTISPIILGVAEDAAWSLPWVVLINEPMVFLKIIGLLFLAAILLAFVPIIGQIHSLDVVILGGLCLIFILNLLNGAYPGMGINQINPMPSIGYLAGFLIIAGIASWIGRMAVALIAITIEENVNESLAEYIMIPLGSVFGFIPIFIYGSWLGNQL